jgi:hypothetical protein
MGLYSDTKFFFFFTFWNGFSYQITASQLWVTMVHEQSMISSLIPLGHFVLVSNIWSFDLLGVFNSNLWHRKNQHLRDYLCLFLGVNTSIVNGIVEWHHFLLLWPCLSNYFPVGSLLLKYGLWIHEQSIYSLIPSLCVFVQNSWMELSNDTIIICTSGWFTPDGKWMLSQWQWVHDKKWIQTCNVSLTLKSTWLPRWQSMLRGC